MGNYPMWFGSQVDKAIVSGAMIEGSIPSRIAIVPCNLCGCRVLKITRNKIYFLELLIFCRAWFRVSF